MQNPLDYAFWSFLLSRVGKVPYTSVGAMKEAVDRAWMDLDEEYIKKSCASFPLVTHKTWPRITNIKSCLITRKRLQRVIDAEGGIIETDKKRTRKGDKNANGAAVAAAAAAGNQSAEDGIRATGTS